MCSTCVHKFITCTSTCIPVPVPVPTTSGRSVYLILPTKRRSHEMAPNTFQEPRVPQNAALIPQTPNGLDNPLTQTRRRSARLAAARGTPCGRCLSLWTQCGCRVSAHVNARRAELALPVEVSLRLLFLNPGHHTPSGTHSFG